MSKLPHRAQSTPDNLDEATSYIEKARRNNELFLSLNGFGLKELPESMFQMTQLQSLSLGGNQLVALPESISRLSQLRVLFLDHNKLTRCLCQSPD